MKHLMTVKEYAANEGISVAGVYLRIRRGKLNSKKKDGLKYVYVNSDKSIKKPRRIKNE